jgi:hypothetical protein
MDSLSNSKSAISARGVTLLHVLWMCGRLRCVQEVGGRRETQEVGGNCSDPHDVSMTDQL